MKYIYLLFLVFPFAIFGQTHGIEINSNLPGGDIVNESTISKGTTLKELIQENGLLVIFSSNTCPFVKEWEQDYPMIYELAIKNKVGMVLINSNSAFRETTESLEEMKRISNKFNYNNVPYLVDKDSELAKLFKANTTPHIFLFDAESKLVYRGSIDNRYDNKDRKATKYYLTNALQSLGENEEISLKTTKNIGCSIKKEETKSGKKKGYIIEE